MALATLRIETNDPSSPKDIPMSSLIGNDAQTASCAAGSITVPATVAQGVKAAQTLAEANAAALAQAVVNRGPCQWQNVEQTCPEGFTGDPVPAGTVTSEVSQAAADAAAESLLDCTPISIDLSVNGRVWDLTEDGSNGIVFVGEFSIVGGESHNSIARMSPNGTIDTAFDTQANNTIHRILRLASGKYMIGGSFTTIDGVARNRIARLNADGSLDLAYDPDANADVTGFVEQSDNSVVVVGGFTSIAGAARNRIARLDSDGVNDATYDPNPNNSISGIAAYPGGRVLVWGTFASIAGVAKSGMAVLNSDGTNYTTFANTVTGQNLRLRGAYAGADGSVFVTGGFNTTYADSEHTYKLNPNGSHATGFVVDHGAGGFGYCVTVDGNGDVLIGGSYTLHNATTRNYISRCNPTTGAVDGSFDPNANFHVYVIHPEASGTYLVGGNYTTMNGVTRQRFTRLLSTGFLA